jgi:hypothetical protein
MLSFRDWCEETQTALKPWKAGKDEILQFWTALPPTMPIQPYKIVPTDYKGSTYQYDGIRITGTQQFINSVVSRMKDLINYDQGQTKLHLLYRQQVDKDTKQPVPNSFVFYVQARERKKENELRST